MPLHRDVGLLEGLFHTSGTTQVFQIFIFLISSIIILLTSFYPRKVWVPLYTSVSKFFSHNFTFYSSKIINIMVKEFRLESPIGQFNYYFLHGRPNYNIKAAFRPGQQDLYLLAYLIFTICIAPLFYFNLYIIALIQGIPGTMYTSLKDIPLSIGLISGFLSCSGLYLLFVVGLNIYYRNSNNMWIIYIQKYMELFTNTKTIARMIKIKYILFVFYLLIYIGINVLVLNVLIYSLGLSTNSLLLYIYVRLTLLPFMVYINNIIISIFINFFTKDKYEISYNIFSTKMINSITLTRLFLMIGFIGFFAFLPVNMNDFILKMDNPGSGGKPVWNPGWSTGWNTGPGGNSQGGAMGPEGNLDPRWEIIKAKIAGRADNVAHRHISIYSTLNNNNDLTRDEIVLLADKIRANGLDNSRPFALLEWKKGEYKGLFRAVQLLKDAQHPTTTNTMPVKATGEFKRFLDLLG